MSQVLLTALGGSGEIGASCFLLQEGTNDVLLDCGIHPKKEGEAALPELSLLSRPPTAVIVTHAHIDHCGAVPYLMRLFPTTDCYTTIPTADIMDRMLHNSVAVMGKIAVEQNISEYPLYSHRDVDKAFKRLYAMEYDEEFGLDLAMPHRVSFHPAGHVLGSASVLVKTESHTLFYTGDICAANQELLGGLEPIDKEEHVDTLVLECTKANDDDAESKSFGKEIQSFAREISRVIQDGGVVLVPCFALGRCQELLTVISRLMDAGDLPEVPVYASGLGRAIHELYLRHSDYLQPKADLRSLDEYESVGDVWNPSVRRELLAEPAIIVATSGMMIENTPSAMLAKEMVKHQQHGIFFVGYLDPDTLGYKLLNAEPAEPLVFERGTAPVKVRLQNRQTFSFSAHAPREDLESVVEHVQPENVVLVHGDMDAIERMRDHCNGAARVFAPTIGETIALDR